MKLNPFARGGKHREDPAEVRAERDRIATDNQDLHERLNAAGEQIATLTEERNWFHDQWQVQGQRAAAAEDNAERFARELSTANRKVRALEQIAGLYVEPIREPTPIFSEVSGTFPLPPTEDMERTVSTRFRSLTDAFGGVA